jgi:hypothetical protein
MLTERKSLRFDHCSSLEIILGSMGKILGVEVGMELRGKKKKKTITLKRERIVVWPALDKIISTRCFSEEWSMCEKVSSPCWGSLFLRRELIFSPLLADSSRSAHK